MKYLSIIFLMCAVALHGQSGKPVQTPSNATVNAGQSQQVKKDSTIYLTPTGSVNDTVVVYAIVVDLNTPLGVSTYNVITKSWTYEDGNKKAADQWMETGGGVKINEWRKRTLWFMLKNEWKD